MLTTRSLAKMFNYNMMALIFTNKVMCLLSYDLEPVTGNDY